MAEISFSLGDLFEQAFGYKTQAFDPQFATVQGDKDVSRVSDGKKGSPYYGRDAQGREYYLPVEVQVGQENAEAFGARNSDGSLSGRWNLPYPVISIESDKKVIDTELTENNRIVSELINNGGWRINIKGFLINKNNEFPEDDFNTLLRLFQLNVPIRINNPVTDCFLEGDRLATIRKIRMPAAVGVKNVRVYELELMSEVPFNLIEIV